MPEGTGVGSIYVDFVVKNTVSQQVQNLSNQAAAKAQQSFSSVGQAAGNAFGNAFQRAAKSQNAAISSAFSAPLENAKRNLAQVSSAFEANAAKLDAMWNAKNTRPSYAVAPAGEDKAFARLEAENERLCQKMQSARDRVAVAAQAASSRQAAAEEKAQARAAAAAEKAAAKEEAAAEKAQSSMAKRIGSAFSGMAQKSKASFAAVGASMTRALGASLSNHLRNAASGFTRLFHTVGRAMRRVFVLATVLAFFKGLKTAMTAAAAQNQQFANSLAQVKGNLYNSFASIFTAILPALNAMMSALAALTNKIASFLSVLFGVAYTKSAAAGKKISSVGASASAASKKVQGALASFDELNVLQKNDDASGGADSGTVTPDFSAAADKGASNFAEMLKAAIAAGDLTEIGQLVADKINEALASIPWGRVQAKVQGCAKLIYTFLNGAVGELDWPLLGFSLGMGLNTALGFFDTIAQKFHWGTLGQGIGNGANAAFATIDWELVGRTLTNGIMGALLTLHGFLQTFDWVSFGTDVGTMLCAALGNIDWTQAAADFGNLAIGILEAISAALQQVDWSVVGATICSMLAAVDWIGILESVGQVLIDAWPITLGACLLSLAPLLITGLLGLLDTALAAVVAAIGLWPVLLVAAVVAVLAVIAVEIYKNWDAIKAKWNEMIAGIKKGWDSFVAAWEESWKSLGNCIKGIINGILSFINDGLLGGLETMVNGAIRAINHLLTAASKIPMIGSMLSGVQMGTVSLPRIPYLANGGVIQQPTLAMVGEYSGARSNPEIVTPESKMSDVFSAQIAPLVEAIQSLIEYLSSGQGNQEIVIRFEGTLAELIRILKPELDKETSRRGTRILTGGGF
ncbi:MAG: hypothetical protein LKJ90_07105 [Faecalibacterium sp.]|jgi:hypothetical protein|nr:hypothetical protein [Faecalibacterium sp.]